MRVFDFRQALEGFQVGFLDDVGGLGVVADDAPRHPEQALVIGAHDALKSREIPRQHFGYRFGLIKSTRLYAMAV